MEKTKIYEESQFYENERERSQIGRWKEKLQEKIFSLNSENLNEIIIEMVKNNKNEKELIVTEVRVLADKNIHININDEISYEIKGEENNFLQLEEEYEKNKKLNNSLTIKELKENFNDVQNNIEIKIGNCKIKGIITRKETTEIIKEGKILNRELDKILQVETENYFWDVKNKNIDDIASEIKEKMYEIKLSNNLLDDVCFCLTEEKGKKELKIERRFELSKNLYECEILKKEKNISATRFFENLDKGGENRILKKINEYLFFEFMPDDEVGFDENQMIGVNLDSVKEMLEDDFKEVAGFIAANLQLSKEKLIRRINEEGISKIEIENKVINEIDCAEKIVIEEFDDVEEEIFGIRAIYRINLIEKIFLDTYLKIIEKYICIPEINKEIKLCILNRLNENESVINNKIKQYLTSKQNKKIICNSNEEAIFDYFFHKEYFNDYIFMNNIDSSFEQENIYINNIIKKEEVVEFIKIQNNESEIYKKITGEQKIRKDQVEKNLKRINEIINRMNSLFDMNLNKKDFKIMKAIYFELFKNKKLYNRRTLGNILYNREKEIDYYIIKNEDLILFNEIKRGIFYIEDQQEEYKNYIEIRKKILENYEFILKITDYKERKKMLHRYIKENFRYLKEIIKFFKLEESFYGKYLKEEVLKKY